MALSQLPDDFKEFIDSLNAHDVAYLLIGGWAVGLYGNPRATKDIDFLIAVDEENLDRLRVALEEFGAPEVDVAHFRKRGNIFRMGRAPIQIDILNDADGIDFSECYRRKTVINIGDTELSVISKEDLVKNKKATGRHGDLADVQALIDPDSE